MEHINIPRKNTQPMLKYGTLTDVRHNKLNCIFSSELEFTVWLGGKIGQVTITQ